MGIGILRCNQRSRNCEIPTLVGSCARTPRHTRGIWPPVNANVTTACGYAASQKLARTRINVPRPRWCSPATQELRILRVLGVGIYGSEVTTGIQDGGVACCNAHVSLSCLCLVELLYVAFILRHGVDPFSSTTPPCPSRLLIFTMCLHVVILGTWLFAKLLSCAMHPSPSSSPTVAITSAMSAISQRHPSLALCSLVRLSSRKFSLCPLGHSVLHPVINISFLLIILSGDIQLNPGPTWRTTLSSPVAAARRMSTLVRKPFVVTHVTFGFTAPAQVCQTHNILI